MHVCNLILAHMYSMHSDLSLNPGVTPSPPYWCLRFLAAALDPPGSEVDLGAAPFDLPSWVVLLPGAGSHLLLLLLVSTASTSPLQPKIRLTKLNTKQLCNRWRRDNLVFPLDLDLEFLLQPPATVILRSLGVHLVTGCVDPTTTPSRRQ
jgi:hypothetical protein